MGAAAVVRIGGPNSGHTVLSDDEHRRAFRQLPTSALLPEVTSVIGPGSYIDATVLADEIAETGLGPDQLTIDPAAVLVTEADRQEEVDRGLQKTIGSTLSGTGAAVARRVRRDATVTFAASAGALARFVRPTSPLLRGVLDGGGRVIVEGTQGHGLSILHTSSPPYATSRDTTAAAFLAEAGLSPLDVDDVVMVIRAFPIRVAGNSGPLPLEASWRELQQRGHHDHDLTEYSTVTHRPRRVGLFDPAVVNSAITINQPTRIALNHLDYADHECCVTGALTSAARAVAKEIEGQIGRRISLLGWGPGVLEHDGVVTRISRDLRSA
jgi:adenylosuccinate synthase